MKKLKLFLFCLMIFLMTGCDVNYNLEIYNNYMTESVDFLLENKLENQKKIDEYMSVDHQAYFDMDLGKSYNYVQHKIKKNNKIGINLNYNYRGDDLQNSSLLNKCYYKKSVIKENNEIVIHTEGINSCFYMDDNKVIDNLKINIKTDLPVIKHNADKVSHNVYTWIVDENNYQNHPIDIKISTKVEDKKTNNFWIIILSFIIVLFGILCIFLNVYLKNHKNNKI